MLPIEKRLDAIEAQLQRAIDVQDTLLTMEQAAAFCGISVDRFRRRHASIAPAYKAGKRLMFKKSELMAGVALFQVSMTDSQIENEARKRLKSGGIDL